MVTRLLVAVVSMIGIVCVLVVAYTVWSASTFLDDGFTPPSQDEVVRDLEHYYAHNGSDPRRPRGELAGCPTRFAGLWFHCEFDYPTTQAPRKITCVDVNIDEPCCSYEQGRWIVSDIAQAQAKAKRLSWPTVCG